MRFVRECDARPFVRVDRLGRVLPLKRADALSGRWSVFCFIGMDLGAAGAT